MCLDRASIAVYACRSLERLLSCRTIAFATGSPDDAEPLPADRQRVLTIVAEADDDDYWFEASRDGNREAHYRGAHAYICPGPSCHVVLRLIRELPQPTSVAPLCAASMVYAAVKHC